MPLYELVYILSTKIQRAQQGKVMAGIATDILTRGGVVRRLSNEGVCSLSYPMKRFGVKYRKGRYVHMLFDVSPEALHITVDNIVRKRAEVFRWMVFNRSTGHYTSALTNPLIQDRAMDLTEDLLQLETKRLAEAQKSGVETEGKAVEV